MLHVYCYFQSLIWRFLCNRRRYNQHNHHDVIKWKHFPRHWPFVRAIHRSPVYSPRIGQWRGALMFTLICAWTNVWVNSRDAGDLRRHRAHYDITAMIMMVWSSGCVACGKGLPDAGLFMPDSAFRHNTIYISKYAAVFISFVLLGWYSQHLVDSYKPSVPNVFHHCQLRSLRWLM